MADNGSSKSRSDYEIPAIAKKAGSIMNVHVIRFGPGDDVRLILESFVKEKNIKAAIVLSAIGSLTTASLRLANQKSSASFNGPFEIVSLSGTLSSTGGSHLHMSVSDSEGRMTGGHLTAGSVIFTTLEVAIGELPALEFARETDPATTYKELKVIPVKN